MAGKKKKTKPAANPARGFATTSIASKPKTDKIDSEAHNENSERSSLVDIPPTDGPSECLSINKAPNLPGIGNDEASKELHELSPEDFEARMELSDLQNFVEQQAAKVKKESARQVSRLQTERRLLRSQADLLTVREWLPDELVQQILDLAIEEEDATAANGTPLSLKKFSEDELLSRIWQLKLTLTDLHMSDEQISKALRYILSNPPHEESSASIWGLSEILDWLAVHSEPGQLLDYESARPKPQSSRAVSPISGKSGTTFFKSLNPDFLLKPCLTNPDVAASDDESQRKKAWLEKSGSGGGSDVVTTRAEQNTTGPVMDDIQVSDVDSDMDPDEIVSTYLRTKVRLFDRNPDLVVETTATKGNKKSKKQQTRPPTSSASTAQPTPGEAKLQQRLKKIESDALFDQYSADVKWLEQRNQLLQERNERRKLRLDEERKVSAPPTSSPDEPTEASTTDKVMAEAEADAQKLLDEIDDDDDAGWGAMFGEPTESTSEDNKLPDGTDAPKTSVTIRNFGKITGISPRRVFEEACRSRDPGAKVQYKMVSPTTYSARHSVTVSWQKDQEPIDASFSEDVAVQWRVRKITITMVKVACSDTTQSEGYISTAALFLLFSNSPKEEKSALRLPPAFRDLWQEFVEARREKRDAADRETIKSLREVIRHTTEQEAEEDVVLTAGFRNRQKGLSGISTPVDGESKILRGGIEESQVLKDMWLRKVSSPAYQYMLQSRMGLPMFQFREVALAAVEKNQVVILCGETGCGKHFSFAACGFFFVRPNI